MSAWLALLAGAAVTVLVGLGHWWLQPAQQNWRAYKRRFRHEFAELDARAALLTRLRSREDSG